MSPNRFVICLAAITFLHSALLAEEQSIGDNPRILDGTFDDSFPGRDALAVWSEGSDVSLINDGQGPRLRISGSGATARVYCLLAGSVANMQSVELGFEVSAADDDAVFGWELFGASLRLARDGQDPWFIEYKNALGVILRAPLSPVEAGKYKVKALLSDDSKHARLWAGETMLTDALLLGEAADPLLLFSCVGKGQLTVHDVHAIWKTPITAEDAENSARRATLLRIKHDLQGLRRDAGILRMRKLERTNPEAAPVRRGLSGMGGGLEVFTSLDDKPSPPQAAAVLHKGFRPDNSGRQPSDRAKLRASGGVLNPEEAGSSE